jgi:RHH-type rel operon transcriptional repressor/antitoxin RelB
MATSVQIPQEIDKRLDEMAQKTGRAKADYVQEAFENALEDLMDVIDAEEISERVRRGEEKTYSSAEVRKRLGLDD